MRLVQALLQGDDPKTRRSIWPEGVYVTASSRHRTGSSPIVLNDVYSHDAEPPGRCCYLTLQRWDPKGRVLEEKEYSPGLRRPKQSVMEFVVPDWQPSLDDLMATDWALL